MADPSPRQRGTLYLIVGPSGAGKDTLIVEARKSLPDTYVFPRRVITRPRVRDAEDHDYETREAFERLRRGRQFALSWEAHNLLYGIPASIERDLSQGRNVVINVSRAVVDDARARFHPSRVILVTASPAVLEARLKARGREVPADIAERLAREQTTHADTIVVNEGTVEAATAAFLSALRS